MAYCYFKGSVEREEAVTLSMQNLGITRGFGVFDFFRMKNGNYRFLQDHLDRFERSQKFMELTSVIDQDEIRDAIDTLTEWNGYRDAGFKLMLFGDGSESDEVLSPLFYIIHTDLANYEPLPYAGVILHEYTREYPMIKTVNYFTSNLVHRRKMKAGAVDVLYHHGGVVSEASRSNVFVIKDGVLKTPDQNILEGVTRKNILKLATVEGLPVEVGQVTTTDLQQADEVFVCSSLKEVCPVVEIDGRQVGRGKVGVMTRRISQLFHQLIND